ncbi:YgaP family membrane protein [Desulfoplanes sp.]
MRCNVGKSERIIRVVVGLAIFALGAGVDSWWGLVGIVPVLTAAIGWCPVSAVFGLSSCKDDKDLIPDSATKDTKKPLRMR